LHSAPDSEPRIPRPKQMNADLSQC
jgi:hypothetical protein